MKAMVLLASYFIVAVICVVYSVDGKYKYWCFNHIIDDIYIHDHTCDVSGNLHHYVCV